MFYFLNLCVNPSPMDPRLLVQEPSLVTKNQTLHKLFTLIYTFFAAIFVAEGFRYSMKSSAQCNDIPELVASLVSLRNLALAFLAFSWLTAEAVRLKSDFSRPMAVAVRLKLLSSRTRRWLLKNQFGPVLLVMVTSQFTIYGAVLVIASFLFLAQINAAELVCGRGLRGLTAAAAVLIGFRLAAAVLVGVLLALKLSSYPYLILNLLRAWGDRDRDFDDDDDDDDDGAV